MSPNGASGVSWKALLICPNAELADRMRTIWRSLKQPELMVESLGNLDKSALSGLVASQCITLCFLDVGTDRQRALDLVGALKELRVPVAALHTSNDPDLILNCLRQGVAEFLYLPFDPDQIRAALDRLVKRAQSAQNQARSGGTFLGLMRGKSGCGSTTIACSLAFQIQALNRQKVLLADLDPLTGTMAFLLKLSSAYSFVHALANSSRMDEALWRGMVTPCRGVDVLLSPEIPADLVYEPSDVTAMVGYCRQLYEYAVLDIPGPYGEWGLALANACDQILLVTTNELPAVHATQNTLACLEDGGVTKAKIKLIVNRYNPQIGLSSEAIETALDVKVFEHLPSDFESVQKALIDGKSIPASTKVGRAIAELAEKLTGYTSAAKKHSLFSGLFSSFSTI